MSSSTSAIHVLWQTTQHRGLEGCYGCSQRTQEVFYRRHRAERSPGDRKTQILEAEPPRCFAITYQGRFEMLLVLAFAAKTGKVI